MRRSVPHPSEKLLTWFGVINDRAHDTEMPISFDWVIENQSDRSFQIAHAIWLKAKELVHSQLPDLETIFAFPGSFLFQTHFDPTGWFAVRVSGRDDGGVTTGPGMESGDRAYLREKITKREWTPAELRGTLGEYWFGETTFTYVGPFQEVNVSWSDMLMHVVDWVNQVVLPIALEKNRKRVVRALPPAPQYNTHAISQALWVLESETDSTQGSGFALDGAGIITCAHVLSEDTEAFRYVAPNERYRVVVVRRNDDIDLAVVQLGTSVTASLSRGNSAGVKQMDHVLIAGHPNYRLGDTPFFSPGIIVGMRMRSGVRRLVTSGSIVRGASGGPVLDGSGLVIGVAVTGAELFSASNQTEDHGIIPIDALDRV